MNIRDWSSDVCSSDLDPYILDFLNLQDKSYQESSLEQGIISNLQAFLLELGKSFAFVKRRQRICFDDLMLSKFKIKMKFPVTRGILSLASASGNQWILAEYNKPQ